ncbi:MAG: SDR family oxidoreductase, partial [Oceanobacter sp.]
MKNTLVAGSTGYLGRHILAALQQHQIPFKALVRNPKRLAKMDLNRDQIIRAEVTQPGSLKGCCEGVDTVVSTLGITRQRDGLSYEDVDYQANLNLLNEAKAAGVRRFIYVSVLNGEHMTALKVCAAKERFVKALQDSGLDYCVIRPNGFFSDMGEFVDMAKQGRIWLFGDGQLRANPIHGADLAEVCVHAIQGSEEEIRIGGPDTLTQNQIAELAFAAIDKPARITHLPDGIRRMALFLLRKLTPVRIYGPLEFFLT